MPKSFKFPLQKVLEYRQKAEDLKAINLQKSKNILIEKQNQHNSLVQQKNQALDQDKLEKSQQISIVALKISKDYISQISDNIDKKKEEIKISDKNVDKDRKILLKATKEKKIVENLRERKFVDYTIENRRNVMKIESEIALRMLNNKQKIRIKK